MRQENQLSISEWAHQTFGDAGSHARVASRANEEMAELLRAITSEQRSEVIMEEVADVVIVLFRLAERLGGNLLDSVESKMKKNRSRVWKRDGTGHGYHVRAGGAQ